MTFEFATAARIIFGAGTLRQVGGIASGLGRRAFVVTGRSVDRAEPLLRELEARDIVSSTFSVAGEPTTAQVLDGTRQARENGAELVIGFGGGSPLDAGKAIAALLTNHGDLFDYLEVIGNGQAITQKPAPYIAIPTTAGPGTEVTRNAVITSEEHQVKVSMRSPLMLPNVALIDPELAYSLPPDVTASTGLDALTQVLEAYVSRKANPLTDAVCREGMTRAARSLQRVYECGNDSAAREDMSFASLCGGLALANAGLGAVHGFAGLAGGMLPIPHGVVCARLLPYVMETNVRALQERDAANPALRRYNDIAAILTGNASATSGDGVAWVQNVCERLNVPPLSAYGMTERDIPTLVEKSANASSMKGNPIVLTGEELTNIVRQAM